MCDDVTPPRAAGGVPWLAPPTDAVEEFEREPTKQREGDQPLPTPNDETDIQSLVIADIVERRRIGIERYGAPLQPNNGRDALRDLYEELIDAAMYAKQMMVERDRDG